MSSSLGPAGLVGGGSECTALSHVHCVCVCVCALGWVTVEHVFRVRVTILGCMSLSLHFTIYQMNVLFFILGLHRSRRYKGFSDNQEKSIIMP